MKIILALNSLHYIGLDGKLPWRSKDDFKHFRGKTMGCKLLVGRTTFESMPPLKGREMIVVGKGYNTLEEGLAKNPDWVIGGKQLIESTIHLCDEFHISYINDDTIGDCYAPETKGFKGEIFRYNFDTDKK